MSIHSIINSEKIIMSVFVKKSSIMFIKNYKRVCIIYSFDRFVNRRLAFWFRRVITIFSETFYRGVENLINRYCGLRFDFRRI